VALLLAACTGSPAPTPGAVVKPVAGPSSPIDVEDLSGEWAIGNRNEPPAGPVYACAQDTVLTLKQVDAGVDGVVSTCVGLCDQQEQLTGENRDGVVTLSGPYHSALDPNQPPVTIAYQLKYDAKTQHLTGTRAGVSFWAAPLVRWAPAGCEPSPQASPNLNER
jgi:hypothetical protein